MNLSTGHKFKNENLIDQFETNNGSQNLIDDFVEKLTSEFTTTAKPIVGADFRSINQKLLESFFPNVKRETGNWVYNKFRWHGYTFKHEPAISGEAAFDKYVQQPVAAFYVYHEFGDSLFDCSASQWPDVRVFGNDIYVCPHDMSWLFSTTHEVSMGIGPFFALANQ